MRGSFAAFKRSARYASEVAPYRRGANAPFHEDMLPAYRAALNQPRIIDRVAARAFFERHFQPFGIVPHKPDQKNADLINARRGIVTAFYEPVVDVRRKPDETYCFPFLAPPAGLRKVKDPQNPPAGIPEGFAFCLEAGESLTPCPDRAQIEEGAFAGQGLEIAWAHSRADVFFAHVQGAARLDFGDGTLVRITYAAKSGHPFTGIGRLLVARGEIDAREVSMQAIRRWLAANPDRAEDLMRENKSYIFFKEALVGDSRLGPVAAAKVPLEPGRSIAVDKSIHSFGTPFFVSAPDLPDFDDPGRSFSRLMIAQDTGSAIIGPARADLFTGSGERAGELAGSVNVVAEFYVLMPCGIDPSRLDGHG